MNIPYVLEWTLTGLSYGVTIRWLVFPLLFKMVFLLPQLAIAGILAIVAVARSTGKPLQQSYKQDPGPPGAATVAAFITPVNTGVISPPLSHSPVQTKSPQVPSPQTAAGKALQDSRNVSTVSCRQSQSPLAAAQQSFTAGSRQKTPSSIHSLRASQVKCAELQNMMERMLLRRIALLGSSLSSEISKFGLQEEDYRGERYLDHPYELQGNDDLLVLTCPEVVEQIYNAYLDAGVDVLATNTYNSTWVSQSDYGLQDDSEVATLNVEAARLAKRCVEAYMEQNPGQLKLVAGAIGPTQKLCTDSPAKYTAGMITYNEVVDAYFKQMSSLYSGGVDSFLIELTCGSLEATAALNALEQFMVTMEAPLPVVICGTIAERGTGMGESLHEAFWDSVHHIKPLAVGLRSSALTHDELTHHVKGLASCCPERYLCCFPSLGDTHPAEGDEDPGTLMAEQLRPFCESGLANLCGGCCDITPSQVAAVQAMAAEYPPRKVPSSDPLLMWCPPPDPSFP